MKPLVSIIVPVYNVESYLTRCLDSLVHQTLKEIQVILVNDGSTDGSLAILETYVKKYPNRFEVYTKLNGGLSDARNFGLKFIKGEYLGFIDSDDFVEPTMFELMYFKALKENADIVLCDVSVEFENGSKPYQMKGLVEKSDIVQKNAILSPLFAWNKIYKTDFFLNAQLQYPKGLWYEDIPVSIPLFSLSDKISYVSQAFVHYWQRSSSIMGTKNNQKLYDIFTILEMTVKQLKQFNQIENYQLELEYVTIEQLMLYGAFRFYRSDTSQALMENAFKVMHQNYPKWKNNPYIVSLPLHYRFYLKCLGSSTWRLFSWIIQLRGTA